MNLVIIEDNELVLYQLLRLVARHPSIHVAGVAADEEAAVTVINTTQPEAVLLDLSLASGSGINVLKRIRATGNRVRVLVLTNLTDAGVRRICESQEIDGFYDKSRDVQACIEKLFSWVPDTGRMPR